MEEHKNKHNRKESIQQQPDRAEDHKKQPETPEPPEKKDPGATAVSDSDMEKQ